MKRKICVFTGTRADYGILKNLMFSIKEDNELKLQIIASGGHFSEEQGMTCKEIEKDGLHIDEKIEILLDSDTKIGITKSLGLEFIGIGKAIDNLKPDIMVVLGDRYELLPVVLTSVIYNIPVAHLHGGEETLGAVDNYIRHAITKLSTYHFPATEKYKRRIIQMGENPENVFNVGALSLENIKDMKLMSKKELEKNLGFKFKNKNVLVTYHPVTTNTWEEEEKNVREVIGALDVLKDTFIIFTKANSDPMGKKINKIIADYVNKNLNKSRLYSSLGRLRYFSTLKYVDFVIGNSSSGIIEVPSFNKYTIDIGDRQKGRARNASVLSCKPDRDEIVKVIKALSKIVIKNIYYQKDTKRKIVDILKKCKLKNIKKFNDLR